MIRVWTVLFRLNMLGQEYPVSTTALRGNGILAVRSQGTPESHTADKSHRRALLGKTHEGGCPCSGAKLEQTQREAGFIRGSWGWSFPGWLGSVGFCGLKLGFSLCWAEFGLLGPAIRALGGPRGRGLGPSVPQGAGPGP